MQLNIFADQVLVAMLGVVGVVVVLREGVAISKEEEVRVNVKGISREYGVELVNDLRDAPGCGRDGNHLKRWDAELFYMRSFAKGSDVDKVFGEERRVVEELHRMAG